MTATRREETFSMFPCLFRKQALLAVAGSAVAVLLTMAYGARAQNYDPTYEELVANATAEGALSVYSTTDAAEVSELLDQFRSLYPGIRLDYDDQNSKEIFDRIRRETGSGQVKADLVWSSAMDLQLKLVNDGYAQPYHSPNLGSLPDWAVWKEEAYGITAEPVAIVYNKQHLPAGDVPRTHADLVHLLGEKPETFKGKIGTYDPERSSVGFLFLTQDLQITERNWTLVKAMGQVGTKLYASTGAMLDRVAAGDYLIAYNVVGSYALERQKREPALGVVLPADYTLILSRVAFIPKAALHPNAAKLFLDHLLSRPGQQALAARSIGPVRDDVPSNPATLAAGKDAARPIHVGPGLLTYLDQAKQRRVLLDWRAALAGRSPNPH
jgi:iron(III) transport system substrate-binding protein